MMRLKILLIKMLYQKFLNGIDMTKLDYKQNWIIEVYNGEYIKSNTTNSDKEMKDTLTLLSKYELQIIDYISKNGSASRREILQKLDINESIGRRIIDSLIARGIVKVRSNDRKIVIRSTDKF